MMEHILAQPIHWVVWVFVLMIMNTLSIAFIKRVEARWVLAAWIPNGIFMTFLLGQFGYTRILGLSHVIFWTPLLIYLWLRRDKWDSANTLSGKWLVGLFTVNALSLVIDYVDVARYLLGETAPL